MPERLNRVWRVFATGVCFACFGLGGLLLRVLAFPALILLVRDAARRQRCARALIRTSFAAFVGFMRSVGVLTYEIRGADKLARSGLLILANHPTLIDVVFLGSLTPNADCIVKSALLRNPFTRGPVRAAGYVCNDEGEGLVADCIAAVRAGSNLIVFPEGTRTPREGAMRLRRGAAHIAVRGAIAITPVLIRCEPPTLSKGEKWYHVPSRRVHFTIDVRDDIPVGEFASNSATEALAVRRLTHHLTQWFSTEALRAGA